MKKPKDFVLTCSVDIFTIFFHACGRPNYEILFLLVKVKLYVFHIVLCIHLPSTRNFVVGDSVSSFMS